MEFALLIPVMLLLVGGIIDFGWYFFQQQEMRATVQSAVRTSVSLDHVASPQTPCQSAAAVRATLLARGMITNNADVTIAVTVGASGDPQIEVDVQTTYAPLFGMSPMPAHERFTVSRRLEDRYWTACTG